MKTRNLQDLHKYSKVKGYNWALFVDDPWGRDSIENLYNKGKITRAEYDLNTLSGGTLLLHPAYKELFRNSPAQEVLFDSNYTPMGHRNVNGKIININQRRENEIRKARKKTKSVNIRVYVNGTWRIVPRKANSRATL